MWTGDVRKHMRLKVLGVVFKVPEGGIAGVISTAGVLVVRGARRLNGRRAARWRVAEVPLPWVFAE